MSVKVVLKLRDAGAESPCKWCSRAEIYMWSVREGQPCYCILTTDANESMREVHHRMPLVLRREQMRLWLEEQDAARDMLHQVPPQLVKTSADAQFRLW